MGGDCIKTVRAVEEFGFLISNQHQRRQTVQLGGVLYTSEFEILECLELFPRRVERKWSMQYRKSRRSDAKVGSSQLLMHAHSNVATVTSNRKTDDSGSSTASEIY